MSQDLRHAISRKILWLLLILPLTLATFTLIWQTIPVYSSSESNAIKILPETIEIGAGHTNETLATISVACVIENATNVYGLDIQISWDTEYLGYVDHFYTMPIEDYPDPIPPSPYNGTFYEGPEGSISVMKDKVDEAGHITGAANEDVMYWVAATQKGECPEFFGNGTIFVMNFTVKKQPFDFEIAPDEYIDTLIHFESVDLADSKIPPTHLGYTTEDGTVRIWSVTFAYPPRPKLKVMPEDVSGIPVGEEFTSEVWLMGEDDGDLDPFWDVQGIDFIMHFNNTMLQANDAEIDPTGWFGSFWASISEFKKQINNTAGTVWIAFTGVPETGGVHDAPYGKGVVAEVTFEALIESTSLPLPTSPIYLENPLAYVRQTMLHGTGLITLSSPVSTDWTEITTGDPYHLNSWEDNGDDKLSESDQIILNNTANGKYFDYHVDGIFATIKVTMENWTETGWMGNYLGDFSYYKHIQTPGLQFLSFANLGINYIHVTFANGTERDLTPGEYTEYIGEAKVGINVNLDSVVVENCTLGVDSWLPWVEYPSGNAAKFIWSVEAIWENGTSKFLTEGGAPNNWYYYAPWPCEVECDLLDPAEFPDGTILRVTYLGYPRAYINYTAIDVPPTKFLEFDGTYDDFLALGDPNATQWNEVYPIPLYDYVITEWIDNTDGVLSACDTIVLKNMVTDASYTFHVDEVCTDILVRQKECICTVDPEHEFYCEKPIVDVAGFPHPDREMCPWHNSEAGTPLPHTVQGATFEAKYKALGRAIDVYTQYPYPYGGQGPHKPSDAFGPQNEVILCATVTYNLDPVQTKLVTFEITHLGPTVEWNIIRQDATDENGVACVSIRIPWPCENPEGEVFGDWDVIATVDIADECVNDTLTFEVGYLIDIISVEPEYDEYLKDEHLKFTVTYDSISEQTRVAYFTIVVYDELGVAIGYVKLGPMNVTYGDGQTVVLECITIPKWAYIGLATVYANCLCDLPSHGGCAYCAEEMANFNIVRP